MYDFQLQSFSSLYHRLLGGWGGINF